jgi:hypothetical protein
MNGVALLVALTSLGVDYSWRTTSDRQQEYTIQIEPEVIKPLGTGQQIQSDVPQEAGQIQRLCIRIGMTPAVHTAAAEQVFRQLLISAGRVASADRSLVVTDNQTTIVWPARSNPEQSFGVTHGWQPDQEGHLAYYVQIDPALLRTLSAGDEIHAAVDPAAGRVVRFVVSAGNKQLPQVAPPPSAATAPAFTGATTPLANSPGRFRSESEDPRLGSRTPPGSATSRAGDFAPPAATTQPTGRSNWSGSVADSYGRTGSTGSGFNSTNVEPPLSDPRGSGFTIPPSNPSFGSQGGLIDSPRGNYAEVGTNRAPPGQYPSNWETQLADARGYSVPPTTAPAYDRGPANYAAQAIQPPPPTYMPPASQPPQLPPTTRYSPPLTDNRVATLPTPQPTNLAATLPSNANLVAPALGQATQDKPWGPLLFVTFALFFSIGGNLYLAYTALEFHNRYRGAIERLRSAARSS